MTKARDIADSAATINYIDDVTSAVQSQIDNLDPLPTQTGNSGKFLTTDGSAASWGAAGGGMQSMQVFTTSGTWTKPAGITKIKVYGVGGGGGGGYYNAGGAGGYFEKFIDVSSVSSVTVTIGAGGTEGAYSTAAGNGGTTSFGAYCSATGGQGDVAASSHGGFETRGVGCLGGTASGGDINLKGEAGEAHTNASDAGSQAGRGGNSQLGIGAHVYTTSTPSRALQVAEYGGGGCSTDPDLGNHAGASGIVIVEEYA